MRTPLCAPPRDQIERSALTDFISHCERTGAGPFADYAGFEHWAVAQAPVFWRELIGWSALLREGGTEPAIEGSAVETARFFPNLRLNYAENLLAGADSAPALIGVRAGRATERWSRGELRARVAALSGVLADLGLGPEAAVAIVAPNSTAAVLGALSAAALGCTVCTGAPELGSFALRSRLGPVRPQVLMVELPDPATAAGRSQRERLPELVAGLAPVIVLQLDEGPPPVLPGTTVLRASTLARAHASKAAAWPRLPFNHPLWVLFTSGTTGAPKCLVHGAGGTLIEHVKEHRLHCDLRPGERLFFHTSTGWMMWNWQLSALASGATLVLYDGPVTGPETLWQLVARERVNVFGTSPAYLQMCQRSEWTPAEDFAELRAVLSTGSILYPAQQDWLWRAIKPLPIRSISGGTDIVGCFVLGNPNLPVWNSEPQCRSLALDVRAAPDGELVCASPFPSRPLRLLDDPGGARFHQAYFARHPGCWAHGDLVEFTPEGSVRMHGRCDGVLNIRGIRIGPAEIYRMLEAIPEVGEALAVEQRAPDEPGGARLVLLVVLRQGLSLDSPLAARIKRELATRGSPAHVPAAILAVDELPTTHSGKRSEKSARDALNGEPVANLEALRNPGCLEPLHAFAARGAAAEAEPLPGGSLAEVVGRIWQDVLDLRPIGAHDNFFDLGGDSLKALSILARIRAATGLDFPLTALFEAPTLDQLCRFLERRRAPDYQPLVPLAAGVGAPLFLVHGVGGSVMELHGLVRDLRPGRPVYALQARGYDVRDRPYPDIPQMAQAYVEAVRSVCPSGPWLLVGLSFGGLVAWEMARRLSEAGPVQLLALLDTNLPERRWSAAAWAEYAARRLRVGLSRVRAAGLAQGLPRAARLAGALLRRVLRAGSVPHALTDDMLGLERLPETVRRVRAAGLAAALAYEPPPTALPVVLFRSELDRSPACDPAHVWRPRAAQLEVIDVPGDHAGMIRPPHRAVLAQKLGEVLDRASPGTALSRAA